MKNLLLFCISLCSLLFGTRNVSAQCSVTIATTNVTCYGACDGTATATITGYNVPIAVWSCGSGCTSDTGYAAVNLCPGSYNVTVYDFFGGVCGDFIYFTIYGPDSLSCNLTATPDTICSGSCTTLSYTVNGGTTPYMFQIDPPQGGGPPWLVCPTDTTTYTLTVTDSNGCTASYSKTVYAFNCTGTDQESAMPEITMYTDPSSGMLMLKWSTIHILYDLQITDVRGKMIREIAINDNPGVMTVDINHLSKGLYIIKALTGKGAAIRKIIKI
jgi:hypothetical protein